MQPKQTLSEDDQHFWDCVFHRSFEQSYNTVNASTDANEALAARRKAAEVIAARK